MLSLNFICFCDKKHVFSPHDEKCKNNIYRVIIDIDNPIYIVHSEQKNDRAQFQHLISILASNKKCRCETNEQYVVFFFKRSTFSKCTALLHLFPPLLHIDLKIKTKQN